MPEDHETSPHRHQTAWFRDSWPFEALERELVSIEGPLRIVSAGCSTGEEAYSAALVLLHADRGGGVVGLDVAPEALEKARAGAFRTCPPLEWTTTYFQFGRGRGATWFVDPRAHRFTTFVQADLRKSWPVAPAHVVFLRNVLRYFDDEARTGILRHARAALVPGGLLILGSDGVEPAINPGPGFWAAPVPRRSEREVLRVPFRAV